MHVSTDGVVLQVSDKVNKNAVIVCKLETKMPLSMALRHALLVEDFNLWLEFPQIKDYPCNHFLNKDHNSFNRTALLDNNIFNRIMHYIFYFFMYGLICPSDLTGE